MCIGADGSTRVPAKTKQAVTWKKEEEIYVILNEFGMSVFLNI